MVRQLPSRIISPTITNIHFKTRLNVASKTKSKQALNCWPLVFLLIDLPMKYAILRWIGKVWNQQHINNRPIAF